LEEKERSLAEMKGAIMKQIKHLKAKNVELQKENQGIKKCVEEMR